jgi:hypothetical protein
LCDCSKSKKEKGAFKTHESYEPDVSDALCRIANLVPV